MRERFEFIWVNPILNPGSIDQVSTNFITFCIFEFINTQQNPNCNPWTTMSGYYMPAKAYGKDNAQ